MSTYEELLEAAGAPLMGPQSIRRTPMSSTWHAHVRIEKDGKCAEYNDTVSTRSHIPTAKEIEEEVIGAIINHSPHLKGGRVTRSAIWRIR